MDTKSTPSGGQGDLAYIAEPLRPLAVPIASLTPDAANARRHGEKNMEAIVQSLTRFGQRLPIVVQKQGMIVRAGNGRIEAAKRLGWTHIAAVVVDESAVEATAFAIADNRSAELAEWDDETLASLLNTLPEDVLPATGFGQGDLDELLNSLTPEVVEDEAPEPLPDPVSRTGDLWVMGEHRLICGDCTKIADVERVTGGRCDVCLTDPPYGVNLDYASWDDSQANLQPLIDAFIPIARARCGIVALTPGSGNQYNYPKPSWTMCWRVPAAMTSGPWGFVSWQPVIVYGKDPYLSAGKGRRPDAFDCNAASPNENHPCPKPIELWGWLVERLSTASGQTFYEPFSGSGTTIIACEQLGRKCYAIEIEPRYVDLAVRRWEKLTGKQAVHAETGRTWAETAAERGVAIA